MLRRRSIRLRIIVLVLVPVVTLLGLYSEVLNLTVSNLLTLRQEAAIRHLVALPVANVQNQLSAERTLALEYLARPGNASLGLLRKQEHLSDKYIKNFRTSVRTALRSGPASKERQAFLSWQGNLAKIGRLRTAILSFALTRFEAAHAYSTMLTEGDNVLTQAIIPVLTGPIGVQAIDVLTMAKSVHNLGEESDLLRADLLAHSFAPADLTLINQLAALHQEQWTQTLPELDPVLQGYFRTMIPRAAADELTNLESEITSTPTGVRSVPLQAWTAAEKAYGQGALKALLQSDATLAGRAASQARALLIRLGLIAGIGLIAILLSIGIGVVVARGLIRQLSDLRQSAVKLSTEQLPGTLSRLRAGENVDVGAEVPQLEPGNDEMGQVREAFNTAARTAIMAAADEVKIRRGVNDVFRSLARRNQSLLTRQLQLLDSMERRVHDPEELADLFRVDHMTTRMRRHAEGLLIVAGGSSGRAWREPVPIVDVMRAAAAEVEDYTRIRVTSRTGAALAGHAVADIIHLLAELVENAATFSPASTPVRVDGERVARGVVVEIEDRGLGMGEEQLAGINTTLADPPLFDLSGSDQLGLFIAGQLGRRHDVKLTLRSSAYGGITAVVLIPEDLIVDTGEPEEPLPIAGIRELGGRPVPELPSVVPDPGRMVTAVPQAAAADGYAFELGPELTPPPTSPLTEPQPASISDPDGWTVAASLSTDAIEPDLPRRQPGTTGLSWNEDPRSGWNADAAIWGQNGAAAPFSPADAATDASGTALSAGAGQDVAEQSVAGPYVPGLSGTWPDYAWPAEPAPAEPAPDQPAPAESMPAEPALGQPELGQPTPAQPTPAQPTPAEAQADTGRADTSLLELDGLPVRVRQANLAPQLRQQPTMVPAEADEPAAGPSPEAARSTMAALQLGWQRGRSVTGPTEDQTTEDQPTEDEPSEDEHPAEPSPQDPGDSPDEGGSL
jgi:hypothetical protein